MTGYRDFEAESPAAAIAYRATPGGVVRATVGHADPPDVSVHELLERRDIDPVTLTNPARVLQHQLAARGRPGVVVDIPSTEPEVIRRLRLSQSASQAAVSGELSGPGLPLGPHAELARLRSQGIAAALYPGGSDGVA